MELSVQQILDPALTDAEFRLYTLLQHISLDEPLPLKQLAASLQIGERTLRRHMAALVRKGYLGVRQGKIGFACHYRLLRG